MLAKVFCVSQMALRLTHLRRGSQPSPCSSPFERLQQSPNHYIYIFSILDLPRSDLGRDLSEKCGAVLLFEAGDDEPRISMYGPYILIDLPVTWKRFWNDQTIRRQYIYKGGNYINLYGTVCITKQKGLAPNLCRTTVVVLDSGS